MLRDVVAVSTTVDQEEAVNLAKRYDLVSIPVIDERDKLVGRITFDDLVDVMEDELRFDFGKVDKLPAPIGRKVFYVKATSDRALEFNPEQLTIVSIDHTQTGNKNHYTIKLTRQKGASHARLIFKYI